jgi:hypothetical protein
MSHKKYQLKYYLAGYVCLSGLWFYSGETKVGGKASLNNNLGKDYNMPNS